ncbi:unnamed protein product, partial [Iphiclides podalirius]
MKLRGSQVILNDVYRPRRLGAYCRRGRPGRGAAPPLPAPCGQIYRTPDSSRVSTAAVGSTLLAAFDVLGRRLLRCPGFGLFGGYFLAPIELVRYLRPEFRRNSALKAFVEAIRVPRSLAS